MHTRRGQVYSRLMRAWQVVSIAVVAGVIGGAIGALLIGAERQEPAPAESAHVQDVTLCTTYALIDASLHHPLTGPDVLPAIAPLRLGLSENPDADPQIRDAITKVIEAYDAILAKDAQPHGLSEPPAYGPSTVNAAFDRVAQVCRLK